MGSRFGQRRFSAGTLDKAKCIRKDAQAVRQQGSQHGVCGDISEATCVHTKAGGSSPLGSFETIDHGLEI